MVKLLWGNFLGKVNKGRKLHVFLEKISLFEGLSLRDVKLLSELTHTRHYLPGETVFNQGDLGTGMYLVLDGQVDIVFETTPSLKEQNEDNFIVSLKTGDFFGELALLEEKSTRSATAVATEQTKLLGFFRPDLRELMERRPPLGAEIIFRLSQILCKRLQMTVHKVEELKSQIKKLSE